MVTAGLRAADSVQTVAHTAIVPTQLRLATQDYFPLHIASPGQRYTGEEGRSSAGYYPEEIPAAQSLR